MEIIIGSNALKYHNVIEEALDLDVWGSSESTTLTKNFMGSDAKYVDYVRMPKEILELIPHNHGYATPDSILTIKISHFPWDIKWEKTKRHILLLRSLGFRVIPELLTTLRKHWEIKHGDKSFLSLKNSKDEFFNDFVEYKYDHDWLHEQVAYPNKPMYLKCLKENEQVLIDKSKFFKMPLQDRIQMFREEIQVIAIERYIVHSEKSWHKAYLNALKKTITNLTKNWATDFIIDNLSELNKPMINYPEYALELVNFKSSELPEFENYSDSDILDLSLGLNGSELVDLKISEFYESVFKYKNKIYKTEFIYNTELNISKTIKEVQPVTKTITVFEKYN